MARSHIPSSVTSRLVLLAAASRLAQFVRIIIEGPGKYHPEQHYMRGPGPKWREKHMFDVSSRGS